MRRGATTAAIEQAAPRFDYLRRSPFALGGRGGHKEWLHFVVLGPGIDLLVNFSLSDDTRDGAPAGAEIARLTVLVHAAGWDGDVERFAPADVRVRPGVDVAFGPNAVAFRDGAYRIRVALRERPVVADLAVRPITMPSLAPNIPLTQGPPLHWVVIPRCLVTGGARVAGREYRFADTLAYHDHNWGHFLWGHDLSWEWGFALPIRADVPWSLALVRLTNRARTRALAQGMFLWRGARQRRIFRDHDMTVTTDLGHLRAPNPFKIPRVMALLAPDVPTDVPRVVDLHAEAEGDWLHGRFEAADLAQVVIPSEASLGVTVINEVRGRLWLEGEIGGEALAMDGRAICEFLGV